MFLLIGEANHLKLPYDTYIGRGCSTLTNLSVLEVYSAVWFLSLEIGVDIYSYNL